MSVSAGITNLADMVRERAAALGDAVAYEFEGRQTSFAAFDRKTNRVARALQALGVKPGERIAYLGKNSDVFFELLLGAIKARVVVAPVNWRLAGPEVAFIVEDCKAPVLFVGPEFITPQPEPPIWKIGIAIRETSCADHLFQSGLSASLPVWTRLRKLACDSIAPLGFPVVPEV